MAVHLGLDGYVDKEREQKQVAEDKLWNKQYAPNIRRVEGSLLYAKWRPAAKRK